MNKKINKKLIVKYAERIDKYISNNSEFSREDIKKLIHLNTVFSNDILVRKPNFTVKENDIILITEVIQKEINAVPEKMDLDVVFEDEDIIIINKPSGMVVHPAPGHHSGTLVNGLLFHFKNLSNINGQIRPGIVHRIDKDTSGLLVVAKNNEAHVSLSNALKNHEVKRTYLAWVCGRLENDITHIKLPIGRDPKDRKKMCVTKENSKQAITHIYVKKLFEKTSLVKCELETGRTHQIRVHLSYINKPIYGDPVYGKKIDGFGQRLHAYKLEFNHPISGKRLIFKAEPPKEFSLNNF